MKMVDMKPVQSPTIRVSSSQLGATVASATAIMGKWTGKSSHKLTSSPLYPRYDSEGKYLGSLPDLATPRRAHGCSSFVDSNGDQVSTCLPVIFLLYFKQVLLVVGGINPGTLSSTEIFFPSSESWTKAENLPRFLNHLN